MAQDKRFALFGSYMTLSLTSN